MLGFVRYGHIYNLPTDIMCVDKQRIEPIISESDSTDSSPEIEERQERLIGLTTFPCTVIVNV